MREGNLKNNIFSQIITEGAMSLFSSLNNTPLHLFAFYSSRTQPVNKIKYLRKKIILDDKIR